IAAVSRETDSTFGQHVKQFWLVWVRKKGPINTAIRRRQKRSRQGQFLPPPSLLLSKDCGNILPPRLLLLSSKDCGNTLPPRLLLSSKDGGDTGRVILGVDVKAGSLAPAHRPNALCAVRSRVNLVPISVISVWPAHRAVLRVVRRSRDYAIPGGAVQYVIGRSGVWIILRKSIAALSSMSIRI